MYLFIILNPFCLMEPVEPRSQRDSNWQPLDDLMGRSLELHKARAVAAEVMTSTSSALGVYEEEKRRRLLGNLRQPPTIARCCVAARSARS